MSCAVRAAGATFLFRLRTSDVDEWQVWAGGGLIGMFLCSCPAAHACAVDVSLVCAAVGFSIATVLVPAMFGAVSGVQVQQPVSIC